MGDDPARRIDAAPVILPIELDLPPGLAQTVDHPAAPLDDNDGVVDVHIEIVELGGRPEPVGVDVHERRASDERWMRTREDERGALNRAPHAETRRDAAGERRLARAERTRE